MIFPQQNLFISYAQAFYIFILHHIHTLFIQLDVKSSSKSKLFFQLLITSIVTTNNHIIIQKTKKKNPITFDNILFNSPNTQMKQGWMSLIVIQPKKAINSFTSYKLSCKHVTHIPNNNNLFSKHFIQVICYGNSNRYSFTGEF